MINKFFKFFLKKNRDYQVNTTIDNLSKVQNYQFNQKFLPLGVTDYKKVVMSKYYYVDKTLLIKDLIDNQAMVTLFTRPRRFGKTLNMSMLKSFFELSENDTSYLFTDKKIWEAGEIYREYQAKYPVIFLSFKDAKADNWDNALLYISSVISREYIRHSVLMDSVRLSEFEKNFYVRIAQCISGEVDYCSSLLNLSIMLEKHYGIQPIIIIDEYDTPILQGYVSGYYDKVVNFMRMFFSLALKDNDHISFGFMTGILRIAKESIFSGLNNIMVYSVLDDKFSQYFGFTEDEVKEMASHYLSSSKINEVKDWYDGYRFGKSDIYNPWSVLNYFNNDCNPKPYWVNTSSNDIIGDVVSRIEESNSNLLLNLLQGEIVTTTINNGFVFPDCKNSQINSNLDTLFTLLLMAGYLKAIRTTQSDDGTTMCDLSIPNKEVAKVYKKEIILRKINVIQDGMSTIIQNALRNGDKDLLKDKLEELS